MAVKGVTDNSGAVLAKNAADLQSLKGTLVDNGLKKDLANLVSSGTLKAGALLGTLNKPDQKNKPSEVNDNIRNEFSANKPKVEEKPRSFINIAAEGVSKLKNMIEKIESPKTKPNEDLIGKGLVNPKSDSMEGIEKEKNDAIVNLKGNQATLALLKASTDTQLS